MLRLRLNVTTRKFIIFLLASMVMLNPFAAKVRAVNNGLSTDNVRPNIGFFPVKSLDGRTICPVVYAGKA